MAMFPKRAGRFMKALLSGLNATTFTPLNAISNPLVANEEAKNVESTVKILSDMQFIEQQKDANGVTSLRLTPSGVTHLDLSFREVK